MSVGVGLLKKYRIEYSKLVKLLDYSESVFRKQIEGTIHPHRRGKYVHYAYAFIDENGRKTEKHIKKKEMSKTEINLLDNSLPLLSIK